MQTKRGAVNIMARLAIIYNFLVVYQAGHVWVGFGRI